MSQIKELPDERTFAMIKPGMLQRRIIGNIIKRIENKGLKIIAMKMFQMDSELFDRHYSEHKGKYFFDPLKQYILSGPSIAMVLEGKNAIASLRAILGPTNPEEALSGTLRGDFGVSTRKNIIHGSDSRESAEREISLFFSESEICSWTDENQSWY